MAKGKPGPARPCWSSTSSVRPAGIGRACFGLAMLAAGLILLGGAATSASVGFVAAVQGQVDLRRAGEFTWGAALVNDELYAGDSLRTGANSAAKVVLRDDTILGLGEDTELVSDRLQVGPDALTKPSILRLLRGRVSARVGKGFGGITRIEVHTPTGIMGVKGDRASAGGESPDSASDPWSARNQPAPAVEVHALYTVVRSAQGKITAAMRGGEPLPVPPGKCRSIYRDRVSAATACSAEWVAVPDLWSATSPLARLEDDLLVGGLPQVAAPPGDAAPIAVGESLLIEPLDPVIEDRTDADAFAGIDIDPLAGLDFGGGEVGTDPDPLGNLDFGSGEVGSDLP